MAEGELFPFLTTGGVPSPTDLNALARQGVHTLVNVSGVDMIELYGQAAIQYFQIHDFVFRDIFTLQTQDEDAIWQSFMSHEYRCFLQAVDCLSGILLRNQPVHCFCRQGLSRSSTLIAASLISDFGMPADAAMAVVRSKNPQAIFTHRSSYLLSQLAHQRLHDAQ